jgi:hypothetical protein
MLMPPRGGRGPQTAASTPGSAQEQIAQELPPSPGSVSGLNQVTWALSPRARSSPKRIGASHPPRCSHQQRASFECINSPGQVRANRSCAAGFDAGFGLAREHVRLPAASVSMSALQRCWISRWPGLHLSKPTESR